MRLNIWLLMAAQSLNQSGASMVVLVGGLIGAQLAPSLGWATMPVALMVVGIAAATVPVSMAMQRWGRKRVFIGGNLVAMTGALGAALALQQQSFFLFCAGAFVLGLSLAFVQQYRFAAMESVPEQQMPKAASKVLLAGLVAAFIGPELGVFGQHLFDQEFMASFLGLACLQVLAAAFLLFFKESAGLRQQGVRGGRPMLAIIRQPVLQVAVMAATVGYAVMSFVMTATPVSMHVTHQLPLTDAKWVIQSHIMAMYLPSLISGWLVARFGVARLMVAGCTIFLFCIAVAWSGVALVNFWVALVLLGVAWNFLFVSGTVLLPSSYSTEERFRVQGLNEFIVFGTQAVASLSSGWVLTSMGWHSLLLICIPMVAAQLLLVWSWCQWRPSGHPKVT